MAVAPNKKHFTHLFPEWEQFHAAEIAALRSLPLRIRQMWALHGKDEAHTCGQCVHLRQAGYTSRTYYKCDLTTITHGAGTDWRKRWVACGKFGEKK